MAKALIADDNQDFRILMKELLSDEMDVVEVVSDGEELLRALQKHEVDVVVTDYMMPRLNGIQAMSEARSYGYKIPFILVSTASLPGVELQRIGASAFVDKNTLTRDLVKAVRQVLTCIGTA